MVNVFTQTTAISSVSNGPPKTTLTEFFALCEVDNFAKILLYADVPQYYITLGEIRHGVDESREWMYLVFLMLNRPMLLVGCIQLIHGKANVSTSDCF